MIPQQPDWLSLHFRARYTHQKNTHAATVRGGLQFLLRHQSDDGNLYRQENAISNQNVAFYSHGIAALALCEAYGMTGDPSLQTAAQRALDFISDTQHRQRGGWLQCTGKFRYQCYRMDDVAKERTTTGPR